MVLQDDTVKEFVTESFENLSALDQLLLDLEQGAGSEALNQVFRILHTVKGTCAFFGFSTLQTLSHAGEFLLDKLRAGELTVSSEIITTLLDLADALRDILTEIDTTGTEGSESYSSLTGRLNALLEGDSANQDDTTIAGDDTSPSTGQADCDSSGEDDLEVLFRQAQLEYQTSQHEEVSDASADTVSDHGLSSATSSADEAGATPAPATASFTEKRAEPTDSTLRVNVARLDRLMNLVGELVLTRNQILQLTKEQGNQDFLSRCQRLNRVTSELQEEVMRARMQPISTIWNTVPRLVRSIARSCGKSVELKLNGGETELDKTVLEAIKDPLTHIIRNAIDHGLESEDERTAAGKPAKGLLTLNAYHESGQVVIEIADDGAGLNVEKILAKATYQGLLTTEQARRMSAQEIQRLIFHPGFSTAESVTAISGRGVGMDVVRANIESIGGNTDVFSREGYGTTFTIRIPLTLAVIPVLIVTVDGQRFAVPQANLIEVLRLKRDAAEGLEKLRGSLFYRLRGGLLPVIDLRSELGLASEVSASCSDAEATVVIVQVDRRRFGIIVDSVQDTEEIVVKPLSKLLKSLTYYAGSTVMGDGVIALILDINGIANGLNLDVQSSTEEEPAETSIENKVSSQLLIVEVNQELQVAVPMEQVERLERFSIAQLEQTSGMLAVQYHGKILPLFDLDTLLCGSSASYLEPVNVLVHRNDDSYVGLVVRSVVDILEETVEIEKTYCGRGLVGSAIIKNAITDIVDLPTVLEKAVH